MICACSAFSYLFFQPSSAHSTSVRAPAGSPVPPANATALANRASLLQLLEDPAGAEAALRAALLQRPDATDLLHRLAALLGRQHRPSEAVELLRQLLRLDRHHTQALLDLGGC